MTILLNSGITCRSRLGTACLPIAENSLDVDSATTVFENRGVETGLLRKWAPSRLVYTVLLLALLLIPFRGGYAEDYVLLLGGLGGEKSFYDAFWSATSRFYQLLTDEYGYSAEQITFLFEDEGDGSGIVDAEARRDSILAAFDELSEKIGPTDRFILFMLGHASRSAQGVKFNLPGRDISEAEYVKGLNGISTAHKVLIFAFPYSGGFFRGASAPGTVIVTSSSANEGYSLQAGFGALFVNAFSTPDADKNSDGAISVLEAFLWVQQGTKDWYENDGSIQSEHPHLEDNGDGRASREKIGAPSGEGTLAAKTFLGKRRSPLPQPAEIGEIAPASPGGRRPELPNGDTEERTPGTRPAIPYDFISELDEQAIQDALENPPTEKDFPDAGAVVLWEGVEIDIDEQSRYIYSTRRVVKIFNEKGYGLGEVSIPYMRGKDDVTIHHARTLTPAGKTVVLDENQILRDIPPPSAVEAGLYVDARLMYFMMPELTDGCIIDYAYSTNNLGHVMQGEFWRQVYFQTSEPVQSYRLNVHIPKKKQLYYQVLGPPLSPTVTESNYTRTYRFEAEEIPPLKEEYLMPAPQDLAYNISISSLNSWDELVTWYATLIREQDTMTPAIEAKTDELLRGTWRRSEKIKRLYEYVATQIRYLGLELGIWAIKPYSADTVLKEGRGDCKDKTTLLSTMLKHAGIPSYPVLISAGDSHKIVKEVPSLTYFNHMILAVEGEKENELLWLDPTASTCAFGDLPASDQDRWTLIINPDFLASKTEAGAPAKESALHPEETPLAKRRYRFQKSPVQGADTNVKRMKTQVHVKEDMSISAHQELTVTGSFNTKLRGQLSQLNSKEEQLKFLHKEFELDERAKLQEFKISGLDTLNPELTIHLNWTCQEYLYAIGSQFILELPLLKHPYAELLSEDNRIHPAVIGKALSFEDELSIQADSAFVIDMVPEAETKKTDVAEIQLAYKHSKHKAEMRQLIRFYVPRVTANQIEHLKSVVRIASKRGPKRLSLRQN